MTPSMQIHRSGRLGRSITLLVLLATVATNLTAQTRGPLFLVGGGPQPASLVSEFVQLAGGPGRARIVVMAMASSSGATSGDEKAESLRALGAQAVNLWLTHDQADSDSAARLLDGATGIWFGGGAQDRLMGVIGGTRVAEAVFARWRAGAVIGGTSAGAAVASTPMITGDERRPGGERPDTTQAWITIDRDNVVTVEGLGLLTDVIVDQHFVRRRRHNRLLSLVLEGPVRLGAGIDESTALIVEPDGTWRVSGASVVVVFDARRATASGQPTALGGVGVLTHVLPAGSRFNPATGLATLP
jgi:cyanophycinase